MKRTMSALVAGLFLSTLFVAARCELPKNLEAKQFPLEQEEQKEEEIKEAVVVASKIATKPVEKIKEESASQTTNETVNDNQTQPTDNHVKQPVEQPIQQQVIYESGPKYAYQRMIHEPTPDVFGEYYDYAISVYQYFTSGQPVEKLEFKNTEEVDVFVSNVNNYILKDHTSIFGFSYVSSSANQSFAQPMNYGYERLKDIMDLESLIISICGNGRTDKQIISSLNNWLISNTSYDYSLSEDSYEYTGILHNRTASCNGFSRFIEFACNMYGIPCDICIGYAGGDHAWNRVNIGGTWYYIDTTWNVCGRNSQYFLSESLWSSHSM